MTRSSIVAAVVVTLLFGLLIWLRDEQPRVQRATAALSRSNVAARVPGEVLAVPAARRVTPDVERSIPLASEADAGSPTSF